MSQEQWKACSNCKKPILLNQIHFICSVSTCNQKRTGWVFCTVECWDTHIPKMNHKECWAIEKRAPKTHGEVNPSSEKSSEKKSSTAKEKTFADVKTVIIRRTGNSN